MIIEQIDIKHFRSLKNVTVHCDPLTALLGRNGSGKSTILYALAVFYDTAASITKEDYYNRNTEEPIEIRVTYTNLRPDERDEFQSYVHNDRLIVTKRIECDGAKFTQRYFGATDQIPEFSELRKLQKRERTQNWKVLAEKGVYEGLDRNVRSADQVDGLMAEYEAAHPEFLKPIERETQFFGPKNVGGGKLDKFTSFVLVPAVRDASVEADKKGVIYELIDMIVLRRVNARRDVRELRFEFKERVTKVFSPDNLTELRDLGVSISNLLKEYAPGALLNLTWGEPNPPEIQLPPALAMLEEDEFESQISHSGHGLQRALILTLLHHLATTVVPHDDEETEANESPHKDYFAEQIGLRSPDLILAIEEPELFLHPGRCRYLSRLLLKLAQPPTTTDEPRNQIIYATHSPYFVDLERFDQVRLARKTREEDEPAPCCKLNRFSLDKAATRMAEICEVDPSSFNRDTFRARALPVITTSVNEGFFHDTLLVVEGFSDVGVYWKLQELMGKDWDTLGISVIPSMGKENIDRVVVVFRGLAIPTYFVFDGDSRLYGGKAAKRARDCNWRYQRLAGVEPSDFPDTQVHTDWAVFNDELEVEMRSAIGDDVFFTLRNQVADALGYDRERDVLKNTEGVARFVESVYGAGNSFPVLEQIVERVTELRAASFATASGD